MTSLHRRCGGSARAGLAARAAFGPELSRPLPVRVLRWQRWSHIATCFALLSLRRWPTRSHLFGCGRRDAVAGDRSLSCRRGAWIFEDSPFHATSGGALRRNADRVLNAARPCDEIHVRSRIRAGGTRSSLGFASYPMAEHPATRGRLTGFQAPARNGPARRDGRRPGDPARTATA